MELAPDVGPEAEEGAHGSQAYSAGPPLSPGSSRVRGLRRR